MTNLPRYTINILGCSDANGIPHPASGWGRCNSADARNRRRRSSILLRAFAEGRPWNVLVDCATDFREQAQAAALERLDAVVFTHPHADHIGGVHDLRPYMIRADGHDIAAYMDMETLEIIKAQAGYLFSSSTLFVSPHKNDTPLGQLVPHIIKEGANFKVGPFDFKAVQLPHGRATALGFIINKQAAYFPDVGYVSPQLIRKIKNIPLLILNCISYSQPDIEPGKSNHLRYDRAIEVVKAASPGFTLLTHMSNELDFEELLARIEADPDLKGRVRPAQDGLQVNMADDSLRLFAAAPNVPDYYQTVEIGS